MIEIMFGESEAGSMKMAKRHKDDSDEEVICLGFLLDIGDIRKPVDSIYRKKLIYSMYAQEQWGRDEEIYDFLIKKEITDHPQKEAVVIGNILGNHPGGVRDWWYAKRIDVMIEHGYIKVDEESENKYARMISRRSNIGPDKI